MGTIRFNLFGLWKQLEAKSGRVITANELADAVGVNRHTIAGLAKNPQAVRLDTLGKLVDYFRGQGVAVTAGDFFAEEQ